MPPLQGQGQGHWRLLWPYYRQAVQEGGRHLPPGDKVRWVASWRSAGADWTEGLCSGLVPEAAEAQLRAIALQDPLGGKSVDESLQHMLWLKDFAWKLCNHPLEQLLRTPHSRWPTAADSDRLTPPPRPSRRLVASLRLLSGTLECPTKEDPLPYRDLRGGFSKHLRAALFPPWFIRRLFDDCMGSAHRGRRVGARVELPVRDNAHLANPSNAVRRRPTGGLGTAHPTATDGDP